MSPFPPNLDFASLAESFDLECKAAQGRDGRGELPDDVWKSYSAMANADGGLILLGVQEKPRGQFRVVGLDDPEKVRKAFWDNINNRKQVSANLLVEEDVSVEVIQGLSVLRIRVPRAPRQARPVHLGANPLGGTYLRRYEGDYQADDETVRRMLAERIEDSRDDRVLKGFDMGDLDLDTVAAYRNRFAAVKPGHVWTDLPLEPFLVQIGAIGKNREEGYSGLRLAGLLMFGRAEVIRDALPYYMVDFQERPEAKTENRWVDRLVPDGTWSGNLYDFFRKVYQKLTADLKVPFQLVSGQRVDDTPVHEALREALANTLIHADYSGRVSILVVKRPDMFGFRNPGLMRIPPDLAVLGGNSDCRNRRLQTMFQLVGYGDHAGSGIPKIYQNWAGQHWRRPVLHEVRDPEQTLMELRMTSLVPPEVLAELTDRWGDRFLALSETARLALVTALIEGAVHHGRLKEVSADHPSDLTKLLAHLVRDGFLMPEGTGRGTIYSLPGQPGALSQDLTAGAPSPGALSQELSPISQELDPLSQEFERPLWSDWDEVPPETAQALLDLASPIHETRRADPEEIQKVILAVCRGHYLGIRIIAQLLQRDAQDLSRRHLKILVEAGQLVRRYQRPNDPRQAYTAKDHP